MYIIHILFFMQSIHTYNMHIINLCVYSNLCCSPCTTCIQTHFSVCNILWSEAAFRQYKICILSQLRSFRSFDFCFSLQRWRLHHASKSFIRWSYSAAALAQRSNFRCAGSRRKKSNSSEMFGNCMEAQTLLSGFHCFSLPWTNQHQP